MTFVIFVSKSFNCWYRPSLVKSRLGSVTCFIILYTWTVVTAGSYAGDVLIVSNFSSTVWIVVKSTSAATSVVYDQFNRVNIMKIHPNTGGY